MIRTRNNLRADMDTELLKVFQADVATCTNQCLEDWQCQSAVWRKQGGDLCHMFRGSGNIVADSNHDYYEKNCGGGMNALCHNNCEDQNLSSSKLQ